MRSRLQCRMAMTMVVMVEWWWRQHFVETWGNGAAAWFWWLFSLLLLLAAAKIRFSRAFLHELALGPLMTLGRFDLTVKMAHSMVTGKVACHRTHDRARVAKTSWLGILSFDLFRPFCLDFQWCPCSKLQVKIMTKRFAIDCSVVISDRYRVNISSKWIIFIRFKHE